MVTTTETWTGTDGAAWPAQWTVSGVTGVGVADINSNRGRMFSAATSYGPGPRAHLSGMTAAADVDLVVSFTTASAVSGEAGYFRVGVRSDGTFDGFAPSTGYSVEFCQSSDGVNLGYFQLWRGGTGLGASITAAAMFSFAANTTYRLRLRVVGDSIQARWWLASGSEPGTWNLTTTDTTFTAAGKVVLTSLAGNQTISRGVYWDDLAVTDLAASGTLVSRWVGAATTSGATVAVKTSAPVDVRVKVGTDSGLTTGTAFSSLVATDANDRAKLAVTGLTADTLYHYQVEVDGVLDAALAGTFQTAPSGQASFAFAFGSCGGEPESSTFSEILARDPDLFVHLGDMFYADIAIADTALYRAEYDTMLAGSTFGELLASVATAYTWSDHDYGPSDSTASSPSKAAAQSAYRQCVPHHTLPAADAAGIYHSFTWGRVLFILTDQRSYKSEQSDPDGSSKSMLGATQKQWLKNTIDAATEKLIVWCTDVPWIDDSNDGWGNYSTEQAELGAFFAASGKPLVILDGDMHCLAADSGVNSPGGIPVFQAAPLHGTAAVWGGPFSAGTYPTTSGATGVQQYGWMQVTDSGNEITLAFTGYDAGGTARVTQTTVLPVDTGRAVDAWDGTAVELRVTELWDGTTLVPQRLNA